MARLKRPRDPNQLAKYIVDLVTGGRDEHLPAEPINEFARAGGQKGGRARASMLSPERRTEIARAAAKARWAKEKQEPEG